MNVQFQCRIQSVQLWYVQMVSQYAYFMQDSSSSDAVSCLTWVKCYFVFWENQTLEQNKFLQKWGTIFTLISPLVHFDFSSID